VELGVVRVRRESGVDDRDGVEEAVLGEGRARARSGVVSGERDPGHEEHERKESSHGCRRRRLTFADHEVS
jgi:hypothetical protein